MANIQPPKRNVQTSIYPIFTLAGLMLIMLAFIIGLFVLNPTAATYFGANSKATRDAAVAGSALLGSLQTLQVIPRWLVPLKFVGVASFMIGIALQFSTIPGILKNRAEVLSACFPVIVKDK